MVRRRRVTHLRILASGLLLALAMLVFTGQASASAGQASATSSFTCMKAPKVQPPPVQLVQSKASTVAAAHAACANGLVPQPVGKRYTKQLPSAPAPASSTIAAGYHYVYGYQYVTGVGEEAYFSQHDPYLASSDYHTLAETAAQSADGNQIVEIGWTVDRGVNGDSLPHLFVFSWVNRVPNCYNGCGYVQYSSTLRPGMVVPSNGSASLYAIENYQGNWWLWYSNQWIGYFPGSIWSNKGVTFNQIGLTQFFGEVSSGGGYRTQMGDGIFGSRSGSASITNATILTSSSTAQTASLSIGQTDPSCFNYGWISLYYSFRYGGPGC